jgi:hypothetical protein
MVGVPKVELRDLPDAGSADYPNECEIDIDFGSLSTSQQAQATIAIANVGAGSLDVAQVDPALDPAFALDYDLDGKPIAPGDFGSFTVTFEPKTTGAVASSFTIETDGVNSKCPVTDQITVVLAGTGQ